MGRYHAINLLTYLMKDLVGFRKSRIHQHVIRVRWKTTDSIDPRDKDQSNIEQTIFRIMKKKLKTCSQ